MRTTKPLTIVERETTIVVLGNAKLVLETGHFRGIYAGTVQGWILDRHRLPDLLAYLDSRRVGYVVTVEAA